MTWRAVAAMSAMVAVALALPAIRHYREIPSPIPAAVRAELPVPPGVELGAGEDLLDAAFSEDALDIVFVGTSSGRVQLWRRTFSGDRAEALPGTDGASMPAWKPGGRTLAFFADGKLKQISLVDRTVSALADAPVPGGASWLADGSLLFVPDTRGPVKLMRSGVISDATTLGAGERGHGSPAGTKSGGFIYVATAADGSRTVRYVIDGQQGELTVTAGHAELHDEVLFHVRDGVLLAHPFDRERKVLAGRATPVAPNVGMSATGRAWFAASSRMVVSAGAGPRARDLAWYTGDGRRGHRVADPAEYWQVRLSPDDRDAAVTMLDPLLRTLDVFVIPVASAGRAARVSRSLGADSDPVWAPDGRRVLFRSLKNGATNLMTRRIRVNDDEESLERSGQNETPSDWRGNTVLLHAPGAGTGLDLWTLDLVRGGRTQVTRGPFNEWDGRWSPDSRWIAYTSDEPGKAEIYVDAWPDSGRRTRLSFAGGTRASWGADGQLLFLRGSQVLRATVHARGDALELGTPTPILDVPGLRDFAVPRSGSRLLVLASANRGEPTRAELIVGWRSLVPSGAERP
ncbi:MAG: hypothetical protein ABL993_06645 [Vicinamibacterales bacterium]